MLISASMQSSLKSRLATEADMGASKASKSHSLLSRMGAQCGASPGPRAG
jgi:hypothetical protein